MDPVETIEPLLIQFDDHIEAIEQLRIDFNEQMGSFGKMLDDYAKKLVQKSDELTYSRNFYMHLPKLHKF